MTALSICNALGFGEKAVVSLFGAGGKTTLLSRLAEEAVAAGKKVVLTTTTRVFVPAGVPLVVAEDLPAARRGLEAKLKTAGLAWLGGSLLPGGKLGGIGPDWINEIAALADYVLVEADGAAGRPVKGFAPHEPVLPPSTMVALAVLGLDALGKPVAPGEAHRPEHLAEQAGAAAGDRLDTGHLARLLRFMWERGRGQAPGARFAAVFNKADLLGSPDLINRFREDLQKAGVREQVLFTAARDEFPVRFMLEGCGGHLVFPVACVVLAAGMSQRMGRDKMREDLGGMTVLERTVAGALSSGVREVVVVTRPESAGWVERLFRDKSVKLVVNHAYRQGLSTSVKAGIGVCGAGVQAIIFAPGDQPLVGSAVYRALVAKHAEHLCLAVYPAYDGRRGNPVLFDRRVLPKLLTLTGDTGGRAVLAGLSCEEALAVPVNDPAVLVDIDTLEDLACQNAADL